MADSPLVRFGATTVMPIRVPLDSVTQIFTQMYFTPLWAVLTFTQLSQHACVPFFPLFTNSNCDMSAAQGAPVGTFLDIFF